MRMWCSQLNLFIDFASGVRDPWWTHVPLTSQSLGQKWPMDGFGCGGLTMVQWFTNISTIYQLKCGWNVDFPWFINMSSTFLKHRCQRIWVPSFGHRGHCQEECNFTAGSSCWVFCVLLAFLVPVGGLPNEDISLLGWSYWDVRQVDVMSFQASQGEHFRMQQKASFPQIDWEEDLNLSIIPAPWLAKHWWFGAGWVGG